MTIVERIFMRQAEHYRDTAQWQMDQANRLANVMWDVIRALGVRPCNPTDEIADGDALLFGMYRASDVVAAAKERVA